MKNNIIKYLSPALLFSFIIWMIFQADLEKDNIFITISQAVPFGDKIGHFLLFGTLALLINKAFNFKVLRKWGLRFYLGSALVLFFAICEEFTQLAFENRTFDLFDILFDLLGVTVLSSVGFRRRLRVLVMRVSKRVWTGLMSTFNGIEFSVLCIVSSLFVDLVVPHSR